MFKINAGKASLLAVIVSLGFTSFLLLKSLTTLVLAVPPTSSPTPTPETITICHATAANSNPYITQNPAKNGDVSGHDGHNGPVWFDGIIEAWGDIIPPFTLDGRSYLGQNWTTEGQAFYNNGCNIPSSSPSPSPSTSPNPSPSPSPSVSPLPSPSSSPEPSPETSQSPSPESTPTPEVLSDVCANIDGIQTSVPDGLHLDASGRNCVAFELGGAPTPPPVTGQVLGATALGGTGKAEENIFLAFFTLGSILTAAGVRRLAAPKK